MATAEQYAAWIVANQDKQGTPDFETVANAYRAARSGKSNPAAAMPAMDPTEGMSTFDRAAAGVGQAITNAGRGIGQLVGAVDSKDVAEARRLDAPLLNTAAGFGGSVGGNVLMALAPGGILKGAGALAGAAGAPALAGALGSAGSAVMAPTTLKGAAALGGAFGAVQPAVDLGERGMNALTGAGAAAGGQAFFNGLARIVRPNTSENALQLLSEGVTPTPGQLLGGAAKRAEEGLSSVPIVGDAIKRGQRRAVADLNRAAFDRALAPVGEKLPKDLPMGRAAVAYVEDALGAKYDALMPKLTTSADGQFISEIQQLRNSVGNGAIDPAKAAQFESILNNQLLTKFQGPNATLTGETLKQVEGDLGHLWRQFRSSPDPDQRLLGDALREVQDILRKTVERSNPQVADELKAINTGYANFKRVQRAASALGADEGLFSPAQLQNAVKALNKSQDKAGFARGDALMQDLSEPAKAVLGNTVPDSGTPYRTMMALGAGGGAALLNPALGATVAAAPVMYSRLGQNALATLLARRPDAAIPLSNALRRIAPYAVAPGIGLANE